MNSPWPPPTIKENGLFIVETDYNESPWRIAEIPYLFTHRGILRVLMPGILRGDMQNRFYGEMLITRGIWTDGSEAHEVFFPRRNHFFFIPAAHANRLPGDPAGKRHWEMEFWLPHLQPRMEMRFTAFWRTAPLPCLKEWEGELPRENLPRKERRAHRSTWDSYPTEPG